jgi:hypothetical protein
MVLLVLLVQRVLLEQQVLPVLLVLRVLPES